MNSATIIGYHYDGGAVCTDCFDEDNIDEFDFEAYSGVVFGEYEYDFLGSTCGDCGAHYTEQGWDRGSLYDKMLKAKETT